MIEFELTVVYNPKVMTEYVDIIDDNGTVIGKTTRKKAHSKAILHPTVKILLFNSVGKVLLQQRSKSKSMFPLCWDISVCEHIFSGESHLKAATRGLWEELSLKTKIKLLRNDHIQSSQYPIKKQMLIEYELVKLYGGIFDGKIEIDKQEIIDSMFVTIPKLKKLIYKSKTPFTPWALDELFYLLRNYKQIIKKILKIK